MPITKKIKATNKDKSGKVYQNHSIVKEGECIFPFKHKDKELNECVTGSKGKWCATEVDEQRNMKKFGFCPDKKTISIKKGSLKKNSTNTQKSNNTKKNNRLNQVPDGVPVELEKYMRPEKDKVKVSHWEHPNRKKFLNWFDKNFKKYRIRNTPIMECDMDNEDCKKPKTRDLFSTQKIVRDYMSDESPYRGLLLFHGLGVGKTCASIAIAEANKNDRKIVILLQKSIKDNYISELKTCGDEYYRHKNHWVFKPCSSEKNTDIYLFALKLGIPKSAIQLNNGVFLIDFDKETNYGDMTRMEKEKLELQIDKMILSKYEFKHTNGLTTAQLDKMEETRYFDDKIIVIDEVHNMINGMAAGGSMRAIRLNKIFMEAHNVRFVFLSGTPMKNIPFEVAKIFNVLRGYITNYVITISGSNKRPKIDWSDIQEELYEHPLVDQILVDSRSNIIKLNRNPYGFIGSDKGLMKSDLNKITDSEFITSVTKFIKEKLNYKVLYTKSEITTAFPDNDKDFMASFYDAEKNDIIDKELFKRRTLGMVSYYASAKKELVPEIRTQEILEVPMSDYMFNKYAAVRKSEIEKDKNSKKNKKTSVGKNKDKKEDIFKVNSSYRAYSRMLCQFVFPEIIERPFKGNLKDIEFDDDSEISIKIVETQKEYEEKIDKAKKSTDKEKLKAELVMKIREIKGKSKEYEKRLQQALKELDKHKEEYLQYDDGNPEKLSKYSPKYARIMERLLRDRGSKEKGLKFIYTEYKTCEGVGIISLVLRANGYSPFKIKKDEFGEWELDFDYKNDKLPKFAVWSGDDESDIILKIYNDKFDELPDKIRRQVETINSSNRRGQVLEILMTTKQGAEGLNTRNVRQMHVVEPYWNPVRLDQVIGRAVRINSHMELPKKDRNVDIYIYLSKATQSQLRSEITIMNDFNGKTSDQVLYDIAERKRHIMNIILGIIKDSAIDCSLNLSDNIKTNKDIKCVNFGSIKNRNTFSHTIDMKDEPKEKERATRIQTKKVGYTTIQLKDGRKFARKGDKIYDFEATKTGRQGNPVGEIITKDGKSTMKLFKM